MVKFCKKCGDYTEHRMRGPRKEECKACARRWRLKYLVAHPEHARGPSRNYAAEYKVRVAKHGLRGLRGQSYTKVARITRMLQGARRRAKQKGMLFNITRQDIEAVFGEKCPVGGCGVGYLLEATPLTKNASPSLDRRNSMRGYEKGNIGVICTGCNTAKRDLTPARLYGLAEYAEAA